MLGVKGEVGADGDTERSYLQGNFTTANGRRGSWWSLNHYDGSNADPNAADVFFTINFATEMFFTSPETLTWDVFSSTDDVLDMRAYQPDTTSDVYRAYMAVHGSNFFLGKVLLARTKGTAIVPATEITAFLTQYVSGLPITGMQPGPLTLMDGSLFMGIADDFTAVPEEARSSVAASAAQVSQLSAQLDLLLAAENVSPADLQAAGDSLMNELNAHGTNLTTLQATVSNISTELAAQIATLSAAFATVTAANAAANVTITALADQVTILKSGFCPPATAGRHLMSLTAIVPPADCVKVVPPPVTNPTNIVTTTKQINSIDMATFSTASIAAQLAATNGINVADVDIVVTDYPVSTTVSFTSVALTSLTAAQVASITAAIDANLPAAAMTPALGAVTPAGRRLLDLSFPVTITNVGASTTAAAAAQTAANSAVTLGAAAAAAGVPSTAVTATPATVSAIVVITMRAASAASAANMANSLSDSNFAATLAAANVQNSGVTTLVAPTVATAPVASSGSSGQDSQDLLALLVLLVIPVAAAAYFGGKYMERRRAEQAACTQVYTGKGQPVDSVLTA